MLQLIVGSDDIRRYQRKIAEEEPTVLHPGINDTVRPSRRDLATWKVRGRGTGGWGKPPEKGGVLLMADLISVIYDIFSFQSSARMRRKIAEGS